MWATLWLLGFRPDRLPGLTARHYGNGAIVDVDVPQPLPRRSYHVVHPQPTQGPRYGYLTVPTARPTLRPGSMAIGSGDWVAAGSLN